MVGWQEFSKVIRCLGHHHSDDEIEQIFKEVDDDGSGSLSFAEFADVLTDLTQSKTSMMIKERCAELRQLFNLFDQVPTDLTLALITRARWSECVWLYEEGFGTLCVCTTYYNISASLQDGGGELSAEEIALIMQSLGRKPTSHELAEAMGMGGVWQKTQEALGTNTTDSEAVDFPAFVAMISGERTLAQRSLRRQIFNFRTAFELFDDDNSGSIGLDEFAQTMQLLGHISVPLQELQERVSHFSVSVPGAVL